MTKLNMTREEAYKQMELGHKISHRYFSDDEYLYMKNNEIYSEEGYNFEEGWKMRNEGYWLDGWSIYKG